MSDRADYYFRQRVTEAELDLGFTQLEQADRNLAADIGVFGIIRGAIATPHLPVPDLTIDLTAPTVGYDRLGQRVFFGAGQRVDCSSDASGLPTEVTTAGNERWLGVFVRFDRLLSDPRTDGNSQQVYFLRAESFQLVVRQGAEATAGNAQKVALQPDELLVCDVLRRFGQTQLLAADLDAARRQAFVFATGDAIQIVSGGWTTVTPASPTVQAALDVVDTLLTGHFAGTEHKHAAAQITTSPHGFLSSTNAQAALDELVDGLSSTTAGSPGASRVGADAVAGAPNALPAGSVDGQLSAILGWLNTHLSAPANAHAASAISAAPHATIAATNVQSQLQEIVADLAATTAASPGASTVGVDAIAGAPVAVAAGTVRTAIATLLASLNGHLTASPAHAASAISVADAANYLSSSDVEKALAEILAPYSNDHFRSNEANAGTHRTIHQPNLGGTRALLWDSAGNGGSGAHFRVFADSNTIWFTVNAGTNAAGQWTRDDVTLTSGGFRFSRDEFAVVHDSTLAATFTGWSRTWRLPISSTVNSAFELQGTIEEVGRLGLTCSNTDTAQRTVQAGSCVSFRNRFPAIPSSITLLSTNQAVTFTGNPAINTVDRDGFAFFTSQTIAGLTSAYWYGTYTALA